TTTIARPDCHSKSSRGWLASGGGFSRRPPHAKANEQAPPRTLYRFARDKAMPRINPPSASATIAAVARRKFEQRGKHH
ncbi:MAG TPA: hypothetical protein VIU34_19850, partial [Steroidobacter sp.]